MSERNNQVAVIDIETTGYKPRHSHIVEMAACLLDTQTGEITKLLDTPIREADDINWWAWIFDNSTLTQDMVRDAPRWEAVKPQVQKIFDEYPVTAFNKEFDLGFLRIKGISVKKEEECIMLASTPICQIPKDWGDPQDQFKWPKAIEAWAYFFPKEPYEEQHRAYDDCVHEAKIYYAILRRRKVTQIVGEAVEEGIRKVLKESILKDLNSTKKE